MSVKQRSKMPNLPEDSSPDQLTDEGMKAKEMFKRVMLVAELLAKSEQASAQSSEKTQK